MSANPTQLAEMQTHWQAESLQAPSWLCVRLEDPRGKFWAWMIHPDQAKPFRDALGPLATGRADWEAMYVEAMVAGIVGRHLHGSEVAGKLDSQLSKLSASRFDASSAVRGEFHPFRARPEVPVVWATVQANASGRALLGFVSKVDSELKLQFPGLLPAFGPFPDSAHASPSDSCPGSNLAALIPQAQSLWEAALIASGVAPGASDSKAKPRI